MSAASAAMNITHKVALAKITPPRQPSTAIDRDGSLGALEECLSRKIVIVEGPAGSAKTGLLAEAHRRFGARPDKWRCAWLSVDGSDDRQRLSRHVAAALKTIWVDIDLQTLEELYDVGERQFTIALSNYLLGPAAAGSTDYVLFVDDLHRADADAVAEFLNAVAEYFPDNVHVVASGNYKLWDNLDLRFRDSVSAFPSEKLAFTCGETRQSLELAFEAASARRGSSMPEPGLIDGLSGALWEVTRGWVLGVRTYADLVSRSAVDVMPEVDEQALGRALNRFFHVKAEEALPKDLFEFAVEAALPDRVCAGLCDAYMQRDDSRTCLRALQLDNVFISPCEGSGEWVEFNPLFQRWLRRKQRLLDADRLRDLCQRASGWHEQRGMIPEAAKYLLMASDMEFVESLATAAGYPIGRAGVDYFEWLGCIPAGRFSESPYLALQATWGYVCCGRPEDAERWAGAYERIAMAQAGDGPDPVTVTYLVRSKCLELECRYDEAIELGEAFLAEHGGALLPQQRCLLLHSLAESYSHLGRDDAALKNYLQAEVLAELDGSDFFVALCRRGILALRITQGSLADSLVLCEKALAECPDSIMVYGSLLSVKSFLLTEMGDLEGAGTCAERARAMLSSTRNIDMLFESAGAKAHYQAAAGLGAQAFRLTTKTVLQIAGKSVPRNVDLLVYLTHARVALSMGYLSEAREAVRLLRGAANAGDAVFQLAADDVEAAIDDADGWKGNSADLLAPIKRAVEANLGWYELRLCIRMAVRLSHEGLRTEALAYLNRALRLQAGQHIVGPFLAAGAPIRSLLHEAVDFRKSGGQARLLAKAVLREFGSEEAEEQPPDAPPVLMTRYGLTERECEVLELLDEGFSRREIAEALTVSINTVKSHVSSIYAKLGVTNRIDAFAVVHGE